MLLTRKQEEGLKIAVERYRNKEKWTCIGGFAGSGKSTLIKFIIEALGIDGEDVAYVAFTGKAATVLKQKGCQNAITAHKLLYDARPTRDGKYIFTPKEKLERNYQIIVVDEVSMLPKTMWNILLSHNIYVLATGDPEQLPPINPDEDNHILDNPHVFLDEIMRQAQESEIIRLSMHIRTGNPITTFPAAGNQVQILTPDKIVSGLYEWPDQILCATNATRNTINNTVRSLRGYGEEPQPEDKIISLKNHWDTLSIESNPLTNGTIGNLLGDFNKEQISVPYYISQKPIPVLIADIQNEDLDIYKNICIDYTALTTGEKFLTPKQEYMMNKSKILPEAPYEFAYGYAITTHKAQGSEWPNVLVFEERFPFEKEEHKRWLYTAVTRASEKLVVVRS